MFKNHNNICKGPVTVFGRDAQIIALKQLLSQLGRNDAARPKIQKKHDLLMQERRNDMLNGIDPRTVFGRKAQISALAVLLRQLRKNDKAIPAIEKKYKRLVQEEKDEQLYSKGSKIS